LYKGNMKEFLLLGLFLGGRMRRKEGPSRTDQKEKGKAWRGEISREAVNLLRGGPVRRVEVGVNSGFLA